MNINHNHLFAALAVLVFTVSACKKDPDPVVETPTAAKTCYLSKKTATDTLNGRTTVKGTTYEYDSQNRLSKTIDSTTITTITYNGSTQEENTVYKNNTDYRKTTYTINAQGNVIKYITESQYSGNPLTKDTTTIEYNADGYESKEIQSDRIVTLDWSNGNLSSIIVKNKVTNAVIVSFTFEQYSDKPFQKYAGRAYSFGKIPKNLMKKQTLNYPDGSQYIYDFTYEFDSNNLISVEHERQTNIETWSGTPVTRRYYYRKNNTYNCK